MLKFIIIFFFIRTEIYWIIINHVLTMLKFACGSTLEAVEQTLAIWKFAYFFALACHELQDYIRELVVQSSTLALDDHIPCSIRDLWEVGYQNWLSGCVAISLLGNLSTVHAGTSNLHMVAIALIQ